MTAVFTATRAFDPRCGDRWEDYLRQTGLSHLAEVVSLDDYLCPTLPDDLFVDEDWQHNVQEDARTHMFHDLPYLLRRTRKYEQVNVLGVICEPTVSDVAAFKDARFVFKGFDLLDIDGGMSALLNCGFFPRAFAKQDLSSCGLLPELEAARSIKRRIGLAYRENPHSKCHIWAIWRLEQGS